MFSKGGVLLSRAGNPRLRQHRKETLMRNGGTAIFFVIASILLLALLLMYGQPTSQHRSGDVNWWKFEHGLPIATAERRP